MLLESVQGIATSPLRISSPLFNETLGRVAALREDIILSQKLAPANVRSVAELLRELYSEGEIHVYARTRGAPWHHVPNTPLQNPIIELDNVRNPPHHIIVRADPHYAHGIRLALPEETKTVRPEGYEHHIPSSRDIPSATQIRTTYFIGHDRALFASAVASEPTQEHFYIAASLLAAH